MTLTKVGFVLLSHSKNPIPSTRISVLNMFPYLKQVNYEPVISFEPNNATETPEVIGLAKKMLQQGIKIAYFQKVHGQSVLNEIKELTELGIKVIYGVCDLVDNEMAEVADATIVVTQYLKTLYDPKFQHKIHVVHDGIECPDFHKSDTASSNTNRTLQAVLVTSSELLDIPIIGRPPKFLEITVVGRYPPAPSLMFKIQNAYWKVISKKSPRNIHELIKMILFYDFKKKNWDINSVYSIMEKADIGIIPVDMCQDLIPHQDISYWQIKSENRLTMKMAIGLPVIASPVPSYKEVIVHGENGFLASSREEWLEYLEILRDPKIRLKIGQNARKSVLSRFSKENQGRKLVQVFDFVRASI